MTTICGINKYGGSISVVAADIIVYRCKHCCDYHICIYILCFHGCNVMCFQKYVLVINRHRVSDINHNIDIEWTKVDFDPHVNESYDPLVSSGFHGDIHLWLKPSLLLFTEISI